MVVDKDYVDTGLFEDGIWLKEPISYSKLFAQSKSYNEQKLRVYSDLFIRMLNFDGITILDNKGRIRAYNVFVETNSKKLGYIVGGARKRAAYQILNSKKKGIIGVFFLSHEGEAFYRELKQNKPEQKQLKIKVGESKSAEVNKTEIREEFKEEVREIKNNLEEKIEEKAIQLSFDVVGNKITENITEIEVK